MTCHNLDKAFLEREKPAPELLERKSSHLTVGDSSQFFKQLDMRLRFDGCGDVRLTPCSLQQGVVVEQAAVVGPLHAGEDVLGHVAVKRLRVALQGAKQTEGLAAGLNFLGGKTGIGRKGTKGRESDFLVMLSFISVYMCV